MAGTDPELLAARVRLLAGEAKCLFVVGARSDVNTQTLCEQVSDAFSLGSGETTAHPEQPPRVLCGRGLLDDPETVTRLKDVDGVVLAVRPGKTTRQDLESCRRLLDAANVKLIAAVLIA